jgi:hypothetical protein
MERVLQNQVAAGACEFGVAPADVEVLPESESFVVRVTSAYDGPGVTRLPDKKPDQRAATEILSRARELKH